MVPNQNANFQTSVGVVAAVMLSLVFLFGICQPPDAHAATAKEIDVSVDEALKIFHKDVMGAKEVIASAKGVLIMPRVYKAGIGLGGEYGEGALRIGGKTVDYYNIVSASFGFQFGGQAKTLIIVFLNENALKQFRSAAGFEVGVDGSIAVISVGKSVAVDTTNLKDPIVAFALDTKGAMIDASLKGAKFTKLDKS